MRTRGDRLLLCAALVTAVDMQVKWLILFFWIGVAVSSLIFGPRELVRRPLLWLGGVIVVAATAPSLIWQARNAWPQLSMGEVISGEQSILGGVNEALLHWDFDDVEPVAKVDSRIGYPGNTQNVTVEMYRSAPPVVAGVADLEAPVGTLRP